jgi:hypothetical protein
MIIADDMTDMGLIRHSDATLLIINAIYFEKCIIDTRFSLYLYTWELIKMNNIFRALQWDNIESNEIWIFA